MKSADADEIAVATGGFDFIESTAFDFI